MELNEAIEEIFHLRATMEHVFFKNFFNAYQSVDNLSHSHIITLVILSFAGPCAMSKVSEKVNIERGSFTPVANKLINLGYILKERDPNDKRRSNLYLTEKGKCFAEECKKSHRAYVSNLINALNDQEKEMYFNAVDTVLKMTTALEVAQ